MIATMTQLFSQGLHDAATVGFMDMSGFNGSFSVFRSVSRGSIVDGTMSEDRPDDSYQ